MTFFFETYGCQMNTAESAAMELAARERGWEKAESAPADLVLLNSCSVRETAETRFRGRLAHYQALKKKGRPFTLVAAGCAASRLGKKLKEEFPALDYVMGASARSLFPLILEAVERGRPLEPGEETPAWCFAPSHFEEGAFRSFIPITHGCDNFCSYCVVPYARGREVCRSPAAILAELRLLAEKGVREITLLGQNVNSYQHEGDTASPGVLDFPGLLTLIAREIRGTSIRWVRFLSANPKDLSPRTIEVLAENPCFCRHIHLPAQHGSNRILGAMNRRYTRESYLALVRDLRRALPGLSLSTDIMVGFPGETGEDMEDLLSLMEEVRFHYAYMYHYNPREGTAAWGFPGRVPEKVKRRRLSQVIALQKQHTLQLLQDRVGARETVLIEGISRKNADELVARTEKDEMAVFPGAREAIGSFTEVTFISLRGNTFRAERA
ncbi:MAG: tRNA (N6-isopentenyl adenosine(37)-C2)-methylthiotransferase MiaB [Treponema sp.]|nr:tRNA (N6-isopentenyl adenosine(37)-C2)-methylthiotransferase MiaB [Treponema sp.]